MSLLKVLDREQTAWHELIVSAMDFGTPRLSTYIKITICVTDINDNPPKFEKKKYFKEINIVELDTNTIYNSNNLNNKFDDLRNVSESVKQTSKLLSIELINNQIENNSFVSYLQTNMTPIIQVVASDPDLGFNGFIQYYIKNLNEKYSFFSIDPISGIIYMKTKLLSNFLKQNTTISLIIVAKDAGKFKQLSTKTKLIIKFVRKIYRKVSINLDTLNILMPNNAQIGK